MGGKDFHLCGHVFAGAIAIITPATAEAARTVVCAGEDLGKAGDVVVIVSWNRVAVTIELLGSIGVEFPESDGEELHDFARVVFIGVASDRRIGFLISEVTEVSAHVGAEADSLQDIFKVTKGTINHDVVVVRGGSRLVRKSGAFA